MAKAGPLGPDSLLLILHAPCPLLYAFFNHHCARAYDQGQASVDESGSLLCVRGDGCGRWRAVFPETRDCGGHRHVDASAHAQ
jgi:hypothetical protein